MVLGEFELRELELGERTAFIRYAEHMADGMSGASLVCPRNEVSNT